MKYLFTILLLSSIVVKGQTILFKGGGFLLDANGDTLLFDEKANPVPMPPIFNNNADEFESTFIPYDTLTVKPKKQRKCSHYYSLDTSVLQPICGYHSKLHRCLNCGKSEWMTEEKAFNINFKDLD